MLPWDTSLSPTLVLGLDEDDSGHDDFEEDEELDEELDEDEDADDDDYEEYEKESDDGGSDPRPIRSRGDWD